MNVLHLDEQRGWRGGEQQAAWLVEGLARRGHRVLLAGRQTSAWLDHLAGAMSPSRLGVSIHRLPFLHELDLFTAWRLAEIIKRERVEIIHAHTSHAHTLACLARQIAGRGKVVVSRRVSFMPRRGPLNRWKYWVPDQYIAVSGKVAEVLLEYGIPKERVALVYSSVDLGRLDVAPAPREALGVQPGAPLIVSAGALVDHKDHATLLKAMPAVLKEFPTAQVLIAGEGERRSALEEQIELLGLRGHVQLLGHRRDVPALVRAADLYVSSSWSEGLGTSVLEALGCGTPVVAAEAGGVGEMILDGETGYLVPNRAPNLLGQAMLRSLREREAALRMAARGRARVEAKFTVERMVEGTLEVYAKLLAKGAGP